MSLKGEDALILAMDYADRTIAGAGGLKGDPGASAYEIAVANGFEGSEEEWLESLKATVEIDEDFDSSSKNPLSNDVITAEFENIANSKQDNLTFDDTPTSGSKNLVTSGGVYTALSGKADTAYVDTHIAGATADIDTENTSDTWVLVMNNDKVEHRNIPTAYNSAPMDTYNSSSSVPITGKGVASVIDHTAEYYNSKERKWFRVAEFVGMNNADHQARGSLCNSCEIVIGRDSYNQNNEYHHLYFSGIHNNRRFSSINNLTNVQLIDKIRYINAVNENGVWKSYIDVHYNGEGDAFYNRFFVKLRNITNYRSKWKSVSIALDNSDISGQLVYNIPANSEPVSSNNIDTTPTSGSKNLVTSGGVYTALNKKQNILNANTKVYDTGRTWIDGQSIKRYELAYIIPSGSTTFNDGYQDMDQFNSENTFFGLITDCKFIATPADYNVTLDKYGTHPFQTTICQVNSSDGNFSKVIFNPNNIYDGHDAIILTGYIEGIVGDSFSDDDGYIKI